MFPIFDWLDVIQVSSATQATNQVVMIAPFDIDVVSIEARFRVGSTSGVMDVVVSADAVAISAGVSILSSTLDISTTPAADTKQTLKLKGLDNASQRIPKASALGLKFSGTLTGLLDLDITIRYRQVRKF